MKLNENKISYNSLSEEDKQLIKGTVTNGCGGKDCWFKPPSIIPDEVCNHHDFNYWRGGNEADRFKADLDFYLLALQFARKTGKYWYYRIWAFIYFLAVRNQGYKFFSYREKKKDKDNLRVLINHLKNK